MTIQWKQVIAALLVGLALGLAVGSATARFFPGPSRPMGRLERRLNLTPEQRERLKAIRQSTREQIKAILTPEQRERFEAMKRKPRP